jgi:hypothetical protein
MTCRRCYRVKVGEGPPSTAFVVAISEDMDADPDLRSGQALRRHDGEGIDYESELLAVGINDLAIADHRSGDRWRPIIN